MNNPAVNELRFHKPASYEEFTTYKTNNNIKLVTLYVSIRSRHKLHYVMSMPRCSIKTNKCVLLVNKIYKRQNAIIMNININPILVRLVYGKPIFRTKFNYVAKTIFHLV